MEARKLYNNAVGQATPRGSASWETLSSFEPRTVLRHPVEPVVCACEPNHYNVTVLLEGTMTARCRCFLGVLFLFLCASALPQTFGQVHTDVPSKDIRVTLLGTASGPRASVDKAGISTLVEAGGERLLFDAGRGFMQRLVRAGFPMSAVTKLFLTHLHSDHVIGVPDLMLTPWSAAPERKAPLEIWGPAGTRDMVRHLEEAFAFDIHMRRDVDEGFSPDGIRMVPHDVQVG